MSPRDYNLGKRVAAIEANRRRIVEAAAEVIGERGFHAPIAAIARRADVAPGTVRYQFPDREELIRAVIDELMQEMALPDPTLLVGAEGLEERLERTAAALYVFFERTAHFYPFYLEAREHSQAVREGNAAFEQRYGTLLAAALGEHAATPRAMLVASMLLGPGTEAHFRAAGLPTQTSSKIAARMLGLWLQDPSASIVPPGSSS